MATRPWSRAAKYLKQRLRPGPEQAPRRWDIVKGDKVAVVRGRAQGEQGVVRRVIRSRGSMLVDDVNVHRRVVPDGGEDKKGGVFNSEAPVYYSQVQLVDPSDGRPCAIRWDRTADGQHVRVSERTDTVIPLPTWKRKDFQLRSQYDDADKDTPADVAAKGASGSILAAPLTFEEAILRAAERS